MHTAFKFEHVLFLDIETVPIHESFDQLSQDLQDLYAKKTEYQRKEDYTPEEFYERAGETTSLRF